MAFTALGVIISTIISFTVAGLGTPDEYFLWQQVVNFFIMLFFVGMIPYFIDERKKEQNQIPEEDTGILE